MASKAGHTFTAGPVHLDGRYVTNSGGVAIADCGKSSLIYTAEKVANAEFIAEAFTIAHETGLTPRQLVEQHAELLAALREIETICTESAGDCRRRMGTRVGNVIVATRAAIAKAEGGAS